MYDITKLTGLCHGINTMYEIYFRANPKKQQLDLGEFLCHGKKMKGVKGT